MVNKLQSHHECPIDILLLNIIDTHLDAYHSLDISPNMVTTLSIICGIISAYNILHHHFKTAALFFTIAYYFDCVDGKIARKFNQVTVFGDYYDHFGDIFKVLIVLYALYISNPIVFNKIKYFILVLFMGMLIHLGCQEKIYEDIEPNQSPYLSIFKNIIHEKLDPVQCIHYTKYLGCGTFMFFMGLLIFFWKNKK